MIRIENTGVHGWEAADRCFILNDDLNGVPIPKKLDYSWYISLARKRLEDFGAC